MNKKKTLCNICESRISCDSKGSSTDKFIISFDALKNSFCKKNKDLLSKKHSTLSSADALYIDNNKAHFIEIKCSNLSYLRDKKDDSSKVLQEKKEKRQEIVNKVFDSMYIISKQKPKKDVKSFSISIPDLTSWSQHRLKTLEQSMFSCFIDSKMPGEYSISNIKYVNSRRSALSSKGVNCSFNYTFKVKFIECGYAKKTIDSLS